MTSDTAAFLLKLLLAQSIPVGADGLVETATAAAVARTELEAVLAKARR